MQLIIQDRDYHIFEEYACYFVNEARQKYVTDIFKLGGNVYAFDSTIIDLCFSVFWWAKFRKKKGGIKVHSLYDVETQIPAFFHFTDASGHNSKAMNEIHYESGSYYIFDPAYNNFKMLYRINQIGTYCLVAIVQHDMQPDRSTYEVLQILSIPLTDKTPLRDLFDKTKFQNDKERFESNGPSLFDF